MKRRSFLTAAATGAGVFAAGRAKLLLERYRRTPLCQPATEDRLQFGWLRLSAQ